MSDRRRIERAYRKAEKAPGPLDGITRSGEFWAGVAFGAVAMALFCFFAVGCSLDGLTDAMVEMAKRVA